MYWWNHMPSPIGDITVVGSEQGIAAISLGENPEAFVSRMAAKLGSPVEADSVQSSEVMLQIAAYLEGERNDIDIPLDLQLLSAFQKEVLLRLQSIPAGSVITYGDLARAAGRPGGARAVGQALAANPLPLALPCHRVVAADGGLGGFSSHGGVEDKATLLRLEGVNLS